MLQLKRTHKQAKEIIRRLKKSKKPFTFEIQNDTWKIKTKDSVVSTQFSNYSIDDINFIRMLKEYIIKNGTHLNCKKRISKKSPVYYQYSKNISPGMSFDKIINVDINSAYWETANMLKLMSTELYKKGLTLKKQTRLAAIGSLAKTVLVYEFDGKNDSFVTKIKNHETEFLWNIISGIVGELLIKAAKAAGNDFLFFWVDGIYLKGNAVNKVIDVFQKAGYQSKISTIESMQVFENKIIINGKQGDKTTEKPFPYRK